MAAQIYFFDDRHHNDPNRHDPNLNINFVRISPTTAESGERNEDHNNYFRNNFRLSHEDDEVAANGEGDMFALLEELPGGPTGLSPYPHYEGSGFHVEDGDIVGEFITKHSPRYDIVQETMTINLDNTKALIFDWDQTMTLTNGMIPFIYDHDQTLDQQLARIQEMPGGGCANWTTESLARYYLHDPDDPFRIYNLRFFFEAVQAREIPVFILTANNLPDVRPLIIPQILKAALNLTVPVERTISAGNKSAAIRDIILPSLGITPPPLPVIPPRSAVAQSLMAAAKRRPKRGVNLISPGPSATRDDQPSGGSRTRRRKRKKRKRRRRRTRRRHRNDFDKELKRVIAQHRRYQIARGDKRFKATKRLVKWSRPNKTKRKNRVYYRKRKSRKKR